MKLVVPALLVVCLAVAPCFGQEPSQEDLAKQSQNPISNLISLPFQNNTNFGIGEFDRTQNVLNIQPVIPVNLGKWNLISRTIAPVIYQPDSSQSSGGEFGLGDINYTGFLSPAAAGSVTWGVGPIISLPTATDDSLGSGKLGLGPSVIVLTMPGKWVIGGLVNNLWSIAGDSDRNDVNAFLFQYFINHNFSQGWYVTTAPIITANWEASSGNKWTVPFGGGVGKLTKIGSRPINLSAQIYVNVIHPDTTPHADWTVRLQAQFLFPK